MYRARPWVAAGVVVVGAAVVSATPASAMATALPAVAVADVQLSAADTVDMVLDLVRHGQSTDNVHGIIGTVPPGAPLSAEGRTQAAYLAALDNPQHLQAPSYYDGVYASDFIRTQETAAAWLSAAGAPNTPVTDLAGLDEINAGIFNGQTESNPLAALAYIVPPLEWILGNYGASELGSTIDPNGAAFDERYSAAIDEIYAHGGTIGANGDYHDVAFSHGAAISTWVMMNVKNPDFEVYFKSLAEGVLPNTAQVVIEGNPTSGWTLVSYNGIDVPKDPGLLTGLFVDWRDMITVPQLASWNIWEAIQGGDAADITAALNTGFTDVVGALEAFPQAVIDTISDAVDDPSAGAGAVGAL